MAATHHAKLFGAAQADDASFWTGTVRGQVFMGDDDFMARMLSRDKPVRLAMSAIPKAQPGTVRNWSQHLATCGGDYHAALCAGVAGQWQRRGGGVKLAIGKTWPRFREMEDPILLAWKWQAQSRK